MYYYIKLLYNFVLGTFKSDLAILIHYFTFASLGYSNMTLTYLPKNKILDHTITAGAREKKCGIYTFRFL